MGKKKKKLKKWTFTAKVWVSKKGIWKLQIQYSKKKEPLDNPNYIEAKALFSQFFMGRWDNEENEYEH